MTAKGEAKPNTSLVSIVQVFFLLVKYSLSQKKTSIIFYNRPIKSCTFWMTSVHNSWAISKFAASTKRRKAFLFFCGRTKTVPRLLSWSNTPSPASWPFNWDKIRAGGIVKEICASFTARAGICRSSSAKVILCRCK